MDETPLQQLDRGKAEIVKDGDGYRIAPIATKPRRNRARKQPLHEVLRELAEMSRRPSMCSEVSRRLLELAAAMEAGR